MAEASTAAAFSPEAVIAERAPEWPVYCVYPARLRAQAARFRELFPGCVQYAVKCNRHPLVLDALYEGGIRDFDTASEVEVADICGRYPDAVAHFQHPVKSRGAIAAAYNDHGVRDFAIDSAQELDKISEVLGTSAPLRLFVRVATPPGFADYDLSEKFGIRPRAAPELLRAVRERGYEAALSFHVGSSCRSPDSYWTSIALMARIAADAGVVPAGLDVGGGFPAPYPSLAVPPLEDYLAAVRAAVRHTGFEGVPLLCEPGRSMVAEGVSVITQVHLRRGDEIFLNDGIYGSFSEFLWAELEFPARLVRRDGPVTGRARAFTVFGPTCDAHDRFPKPVHLPQDARTGDWIVFDMMGAYSNALRSGFNGFYPDEFVTIHE